MKKSIPAESPDAYVESLTGWQRTLVEEMRGTVRESAQLDEVIKWGHLVYMSDGPALLIRAEEKRVLLGFWRGKQLRSLEPRLRAGGKYDMASIAMAKGDSIEPAVVRRLTKEAIALNKKLGNPTRIARPK